MFPAPTMILTCHACIAMYSYSSPNGCNRPERQISVYSPHHHFITAKAYSISCQINAKYHYRCIYEMTGQGSYTNQVVVLKSQHIHSCFPHNALHPPSIAVLYKRHIEHICQRYTPYYTHTTYSCFCCNKWVLFTDRKL